MLLFLINEFSFFFQNSNPIQSFINKNQRIDNSNLNGEINIFISNCFFKTITYNNHGGAISIILTTNINILIEENIFFEITISGGYIHGGAIYLDDIIGNFILNKNCGNYCNTGFYNPYGSGGQFCQITGNYSYLNLLSILNCHQFINDPQRSNPILLQNGYQKCKFSNSSNHFAYTGSCICFLNPIFLIADFSTYRNTSSTYATALFCYGGLGYIQNSNILNHNSPNRGIITIWAGGKYYFSDCIFSQNNNILLSWHDTSCFLEITNSYIDHVLNMIGLDSCHTLKNNFYTFTNTYNLIHFKSIYCFAENPFKEKFNSKKYKVTNF